ncbi:glucosyltransferase domain-containing protein [Pseudobutyrivibrio sp.]|uniref:glucosyltransferase domain-containing protein n=1 Tax=Pseudobutyrivibrio sp. TaxID=2014367 RepID=UPI00386B947F
MNKIKEYWAKIIDLKILLFSIVAFVGIHGEMIFNKLSWGDDMMLITNGDFHFDTNGRWFAMFLWNLVKTYTGAESLPTFSAMVAALSLALIACLYIYLFDIEGIPSKFAVSLVVVSIPSIASHLGYMTFMGLDYFGLLIAVLSVLIIADKHECKVWRFILASVVLCLALGMYQWHLTVYLTSVLLILIYEILSDDGLKITKFLTRGIYLVGSALLGLGLYLGVLKWYLKHYNIWLNWYAGIDTYGIVSFDEYIARLKLAYTDFWTPAIDTRYAIFPFHNESWHIWLMRILIIGALLIVAKLIIEKKYIAIAQFAFCVAIVPMAFNFNFILYGEQNTHAIHMWHFCLLFLMIIWMYKESLSFFVEFIKNEKLKTVIAALSIIPVAFVLLFGVVWARYDNVNYLTAELHQSQSVSYLNRMIARMESQEGYHSDMPVAIIGDRNNIIDNDIRIYDKVINPYQYNPINCGDTYAYLKNLCGYAPAAIADPEEMGLYSNEEFLAMPCYPDAGSIKVIEGVLVVKCYYEQ